jgi:hypothetical protein
MNTYFLAWMVLIGLGQTMASTCPNLFPRGYSSPPVCKGCAFNFTLGIPPPTNLYTFGLKPPTLTNCEVNEFNLLCVERINMYRNGTLVYSNGMNDPTLGTPPPLQYIQAMDQCHSGTHSPNLVYQVLID